MSLTKRIVFEHRDRPHVPRTWNGDAPNSIVPSNSGFLFGLNEK